MWVRVGVGGGGGGMESKEGKWENTNHRNMATAIHLLQTYTKSAAVGEKKKKKAVNIKAATNCFLFHSAPPEDVGDEQQSSAV